MPGEHRDDTALTWRKLACAARMTSCSCATLAVSLLWVLRTSRKVRLASHTFWPLGIVSCIALLILQHCVICDTPAHGSPIPLQGCDCRCPSMFSGINCQGHV